jgi:hypothetical protein
MKCREIGVGGTSIVEYPIIEPATLKPIIIGNTLTNEDYERLYHNEPLIEVNGRKLPFVFFSQFNNLNQNRAIPSPSQFVAPEKFRAATTAISSTNPLKRNDTMICIDNMTKDGDDTVFEVREGRYSDFMATNRSQDIYLRQLDSSFGAEETLRDHEIVDGRQVPIRESNLTNMMGVGFLVLNEVKNYFVFGKRGKDLAVQGGTIGIPGGTPEWRNKTSNIYHGLPAHLEAHFADEMKEELCLDRGEYSIGRGYWVRDFTRAPDLLVTIRTSTPIVEIARRCETSDSAKAEHSSLFAIPATREALYSLSDPNSPYNINAPSQVNMELFLE